MIITAYLLPLAALLVLYFEFGLQDPWWLYVIVGVVGEVAAVLCHTLFLRANMRFYEFLGARVDTVQYEAEWTEVRHETRTYRDRNGRSQTRTVTRYIHHPERYTIVTDTMHTIVTTRAYFQYIGMRWGIRPVPDKWFSTRIRGNWRYGSHYSFADLPDEHQADWRYWVPVTIPSPYKNRIRAAGSNSVFRFHAPDAETARAYGLADYPTLCMHDAPAVLSADLAVSEKGDALMRAFNGRYGAERQMRLYVILFDVRKHRIDAAEMQRAYWQGGHKNEFVVCIGLDPDSNRVDWARAFSWADDQTCEVELATWLTEQEPLDWQEFYDYLVENTARWKRKEFSDFDYIRVSLSLSQVLWSLLICTAVNALAVWGALEGLAYYYSHYY